MTQYQDLEWVVTRCEHEFPTTKTEGSRHCLEI